MPKPFKDPRTGIYYFRRVVPVKLREAIQKSEIKVSLKTKNLSDSVTAFHEEAAYCSKLFTNAKLGDEYLLTHKTTKELTGQWLSLRLIEDDSIRSITNPEDGLLLDMEGYYGSYLKTLCDCLEANDYSLVDGDIDHVIHINGLPIIKWDKNYNTLAKEVLLAKIRFIEVVNNRSTGDFSDQLKDVLSSYPVASYTITLQDLYDAFAKDSKASKSTLSTYKNATKLLIDLHPTVNAFEFDRVMIREYRDLLLQVPRLKSKIGHMSLLEFVRYSKVNNIDDFISPKTVNKNIKSISAILSWGERNGYFDNTPNWNNPAQGIKADESNEESKLPFDNADIKAIFDNSYNSLTGSKYWIPLISLYSGARLEEIGQLLVTDIKEDQEFGFWYMDINKNEEGKSLKNKTATRLVPIHNRLIELGFIDYLDDSGRIFKDLSRKTKSDKLTPPVSKWFGKYKVKKGVDSKLKTFHSFRHLFKDVARRYMSNEELSDAITGHTNSSIGRKYGLGYGLEKLNEGIQSIRFDIEQIQKYDSKH